MDNWKGVMIFTAIAIGIIVWADNQRAVEEPEVQTTEYPDSVLQEKLRLPESPSN